jgi:hypothetical protein
LFSAPSQFSAPSRAQAGKDVDGRDKPGHDDNY